MSLWKGPGCVAAGASVIGGCRAAGQAGKGLPILAVRRP